MLTAGGPRINQTQSIPRRPDVPGRRSRTASNTVLAAVRLMKLSWNTGFIMLTLEGCRQRRKRLWDRVDSAVDWIVIADPQHLVYLANYFQSPFIFRSTNGAALLVLGRDGSATLVCDNQLKI